MEDAINEYLAAEHEALEAERRADEADFDEDHEAEEEELFPAELDVTRYVEQALRDGISPFQLADAILAGFNAAKVDPFKAEQCADHLLDRAFEAQKNS